MKSRAEQEGGIRGGGGENCHCNTPLRNTTPINRTIPSPPPPTILQPPTTEKASETDNQSNTTNIYALVRLGVVVVFQKGMVVVQQHIGECVAHHGKVALYIYTQQAEKTPHAPSSL
ncbi:hypothetical protein CEXT_712411 [Caerostris extrusa]|uniref:Uncharacterized protein n=1 Tax=Caerostris extrusa TaxID=172846 RepID=A0AAV4U4I4_CAEEX|nr:hypothetical protein CEXT_712411 [Caerostris extrusa]